MSVLASVARYFDGGKEEPAPPRLAPPAVPHGFLSAGLAFKGEVKGEGDLFIAGAFEGEIAVSGTVRVGESAQVEANISAAAIIIAGVVRGNVSAETRVEMLPTGTLTGTVRSGSLFANEGASLRGEVWLERARAPLAGAVSA
jgi:cytoskeletal protein CcmA (bactofilin family)